MTIKRLWQNLFRRARLYDLTEPQSFEHMPAYKWKWPTDSWFRRRLKLVRAREIYLRAIENEKTIP